MRSTRTALTGALPAVAALLLALPGAGLAQDAPMTYAEGSAQTLLRGGVPRLDAFTLVSGARDASAGTLTLRFAQDGGPGTLTIMTPDVAGTHAAAPRPPRGAGVTWKGLHGRSGARGICLVSWRDMTPEQVSGSFTCPKERLTTGARARYSLAGTFTARTVPADGIGVIPELPIHPAGTPVDLAGRTVTVTGATDVQGACAPGRAKGAKAGPCPARHLPLDAHVRAVAFTMCVSDSADALSVRGRTGLSPVLFAGAPDALVPLGLPLAIADATVTTRGLPRVIDQGSCVDGHLVTDATGPLVVWAPADGSAPVGWTLDPDALPPTAEGPGPSPSGPPASPTPAILESRTYTSGAADIVVDGAVSAAADDLVLTEGSLTVGTDGTSLLHLSFGSASGTLGVELPGPTGTFVWDPGAATDTERLGFAVGAATMDPALSGCQVIVEPTDTGGVSGTYLCMPPDGGSASGAFVANP